MLPATKRVSVLEFERRPETNRIEELIEGEICLAPEPTLDHQDVVLNIATALREWARRTHAGRVFVAPTGVRLAWDTLLEPDVLFVSAARADLLRPEAVFGAPDLVVEVLSPGSIRNDRIRKFRLYAQHGVAEYWIADPVAKTVERYDLGPEGYVLAATLSGEDTVTSPQLPGFALSIPATFAP